MAFPGDLQPVDVPRALRGDPLLSGAGVAAEVRHDLGVDGGGVRRVGGQLRDMVGVVPRLLVLIGKGALHAVRLGDEAVVIGLVRCRRRRGLQRGYRYLDTAGELCAERKAEKHAQRPCKNALLLHIPFPPCSSCLLSAWVYTFIIEKSSTVCNINSGKERMF